MGEHVGQPDDRGLALAVVGVVALDHARERLGQAPAAREHAADERVIDAELSALGGQPLLWRAGVAVDLARVSGVRLHEHQLADVVQQRGDHQPVTRVVADLPPNPVGGPLGRDRVQPEPLGHPLPQGVALEEVERPRAGRDRAHPVGREHLDRLDDAVDPPAAAVVDAVGEPQHA